MWDCPKCGTQSIQGLDNCPVCGLARPEGAVAASVLPAEDVSAAPNVAGESGSLAGETDEAAADAGPQAPDEMAAPDLEPEDQVEDSKSKSKK